MVAVMTMNIGYLLSILAGVFVGSMVFGRFMAHSVTH
jgi:copper transporter 1